jgi:hypothetical protein
MTAAATSSDSAPPGGERLRLRLQRLPGGSQAEVESALDAFPAAGTAGIAAWSDAPIPVGGRQALRRFSAWRWGWRCDPVCHATRWPEISHKALIIGFAAIDKTTWSWSSPPNGMASGSFAGRLVNRLDGGAHLVLHR